VILVQAFAFIVALLAALNAGLAVFAAVRGDAARAGFSAAAAMLCAIGSVAMVVRLVAAS
jgi:hypothetical protein